MSEIDNLRGEIEQLKRDIRALQTQSPLERSSVTGGRLRFIGGLLLIDSGGTLTVIGHFNGSGDFEWTGPWTFTGTGHTTGALVVDGPWALKGDGEITGDVEITGDLDLLDGGVFRSENVRIEDGKIYVGAGGNQIVIDGATGKITAGNLTIDPSSNGGSVKFGTGPEVFAFGGELDLYSTSGGAYVTLNGTAGELHGPSVRYIRVTAGGFQLVGLPTKTTTETGLPAGVVHADSSGNLFRVIPG